MIRIILFNALVGCLSATATGAAERVRDLEVDCWHKGVENGAFHCSYVVVTGKAASDARTVVPELLAPDGDGPLTREQAWRACRAMGFRLPVAYELEEAQKEKPMLTINESLREGELRLLKAKFIQHLVCE